jgi:Yip1-like protein
MNLQSRVMNILTKPKEEWPVIANETADVPSLYKEYIVPLAAIPAVCGFIGMTIVGVSIPFIGTFRTPIPSGLTSMIVQYVLLLVGVYVAAIIIQQLAPTFQSSGGIDQALKLVAYAWTPAWIAGVLALIPALNALSILGGLYGIYLFFLGLPHVMKTPKEKVIPYMVVAAVVILIINVVIASISGLLISLPRPM